MDKAVKIFEKFNDRNNKKDAIGGVETIKVLMDICKKENPKSVLELGGGKGTLSYTILANSEAVIDIYEPLEEFRNIIDANLNFFAGRYKLMSSYMTLPPSREYDLIIVDGGKKASEGGGGFAKIIACYILSLDSVKTIIIEGQRKSQKYWVTEALWRNYLYRPIKHKDSTEGRKGCLEIKCKKSTNILFNFFSHFYYRKKIY